MNTALLPETHSLAEQVRSLLATVECLRHEVAELRVENADLRQQVRELWCDVAYWKSRHDIEANQIQLARQLTRDHGEIRQLALDERPDSQVSHRIADIQERIEKAELELAKVNRQLVNLEKHEMSTQEIEDALTDFDRIWDALTTREQSQLVALLVSKVEFDQSDCTTAITFHSSGIETLEQKSQEV